MKIYKYILLHFVIRHHYSRLSWAFNFSYWWLLRCVTRSRYRPRASVGIPDVGWCILPYNWGGGTASPRVSRHFNHWWQCAADRVRRLQAVGAAWASRQSSGIVVSLTCRPTMPTLWQRRFGFQSASPTTSSWLSSSTVPKAAWLTPYLLGCCEWFIHNSTSVHLIYKKKS